MLVLFETPAGYALFKAQSGIKGVDADELWKHFTSPEKAAEASATTTPPSTSPAATAPASSHPRRPLLLPSPVSRLPLSVKLKAFSKFEDTTAALSAATAICDGKLDRGLKAFLTSSLGAKAEKVTLGVADSKLGSLIKDKLGVQCVYDASVAEVVRGIRQHLHSLISGLAPSDTSAFQLGLSHSLARYKLKFSPDKVDTMIIQAIALLDELDKELNTYAMRVREWYGWHFPEMGKIIADNIHYAKVVQKMEVRTACREMDFSDVLEEEVEAALKEAAEVSMGTEIAEEDVENISALCSQVIHIAEYRASLYEYLKHRMNAIAPNLTVMVGELVGARLIAHAGSLLSLAKQPASTVQILGAEKALFRALKTKHDTPKYGLIYHASLVGQAAPKAKGKISRMLAAKTALCIRMDALGEVEGVSIGLEGREKVEMRLRELEGGHQAKGSSAPKKPDTAPYKKPSTTRQYNTEADVSMDHSNGAAEEKKERSGTTDGATNGSADGEGKEKKKKDKKRKADDEEGGEAEKPKKKKEKKRDND